MTMGEQAPCVMAIVSKAIFDKQAKGAEVGTVVPFDRYTSGNKALEPLRAGGKLFMVTVRSEKERLWLVGVLEQLTPKDGAWIAAQANRAPIVDISDLRSQITFDSGKGITAKPGALGMSLQTPRVLAASDVELLLGAVGGGGAPAPATGGGATARSTSKAEDAERAKLLAAVLAAPEDDAPRLVLADWLQERGDPRGELISIQCLLAAGPEFPTQRRSLKQREQELLAEHGERWSAPVDGLASEHKLRRGFIDEVHASAKKLLPAAAGLFAQEPVSFLDLSGLAKNDCKTIAGSPWLAQVRRLRLRGELKNPGVTALAASPHLMSLTSLNLGQSGIGSAGAGALAGARIRGLRSLSLSGNPLTDEGLIALLATPLLARCRRLYLARCRLSDLAAKELASASHLDQLSGLCLGGNAIGDEGAIALAKSPYLKHLRRLELPDELSAETRTLLEERFGRALRFQYGGGDFGDDDGEDYDE
jgi:uncharacterized protein (TIGR02996 family)